MIKSLLIKICTSGGDPLLPSPLAETHHPLFGLQKCSASVNGCFFCMEEFISIPFLHPQFHVRCCFCQTPPLLPSATQQQSVMKCWWEGSASTAIPHQHLPLTSWANIIKQEGLLSEQPSYIFLLNK